MYCASWDMVTLDVLDLCSKYVYCTVIHSLHQSPSGNLGCLLIMCCSCEITWHSTSEEVEEAGVWSPSIHQINMLITGRRVEQDHMYCHDIMSSHSTAFLGGRRLLCASLHSEESPPWKDCEWIENRLLYILYYMPLLSGYVCDRAASLRLSANADLATTLKCLAIDPCWSPANLSTRAVTSLLVLHTSCISLYTIPIYGMLIIPPSPPRHHIETPSTFVEGCVARYTLGKLH